MTTPKDSDTSINLTSGPTNNITNRGSSETSSNSKNQVLRILSVMGNNRVLVQLKRTCDYFKLGIMRVKNTEASKLTIMKLDYEIEELELDFPATFCNKASILVSSPNFLFISNEEKQQLNVYFNEDRQNSINFTNAAVLDTKDVREKGCFIDTKDLKAYEIRYNPSNKIMSVHRFKIECGNNKCEKDEFKINLSDLGLGNDIRCVLTSKSSYLVAWNYNKIELCYIDFVNNKKAIKSFMDLKIQDVKVIPDTDNLIVLNNYGSLDYINLQAGERELQFNLYKDHIIKFPDYSNSSIRRYRNLLFLTIDSSFCEIYDLDRLKENLPDSNQPKFRLNLGGSISDISMTQDSKRLVIINSESIKHKFVDRLYAFEVNENNNTLNQIEIDMSLVSLTDFKFSSLIAMDNSIIILKDNKLYGKDNQIFIINF